MATIVNNPGPGDSQNGSSGWIVAIIAIVVLVAIGYFVMRNTSQQPAPQAPATQDQTPSQTIVNPPATINNTTVNATTTVNNSTTTR